MISLPWKTDEERPQAKSNYQMAVNRLETTTRRLDPMVAEACTETIESHEKKGYIRKVAPEEEKKGNGTFLILLSLNQENLRRK